MATNYAEYTDTFRLCDAVYQYSSSDSYVEFVSDPLKCTHEEYAFYLDELIDPAVAKNKDVFYATTANYREAIDLRAALSQVWGDEFSASELPLFTGKITVSVSETFLNAVSVDALRTTFYSRVASLPASMRFVVTNRVVWECGESTLVSSNGKTRVRFYRRLGAAVVPRNSIVKR